MHTRALFSLLLLPAAATACTAILGGFSVGTSSGGDAGDSGGDVISSPDGGPDSGFPMLACAEVSNQRHPLTQNNSLNAVGLRIAQIPNGPLRAVLANIEPNDGGQGPSVVFHAFSFDQHNGNNAQDVPLQTTSYQPLAVVRYPGQPGGQPGGFAVLYLQGDPSSSTTFLYVARFADDATTWTPPVQLSNVGSANNNTEGTLVVLDPANETYYVVFSSISNGQQTILAGRTSGSADQLAQVASFPALSNGSSYDLLTPGIAMAGPQPYILLNQNTNGPPQPGQTELMLVPGGKNVTITPPGNLNYLPAGLTNSADKTAANAMFLSANLAQEQGSYLVGRVPFSSLAAFDPATLPSSTPPPRAPSDAGYTALTNILFNNSPHWEMTPSGEQLLYTAPTVDPLFSKFYGGVNFAWWDAATGTMRAYAAATNHLLGDIPFIVGSDATFMSLTGNVAQLEIAYLSTPAQPTQDNPPPASDLWISQIGCQLP